MQNSQKKKHASNRFGWFTLLAFAVLLLSLASEKKSEAACAHRYTGKRTYAATCTSRGRTETICASCRIVLNTTYTSSLGHSWTAATCSMPRHCTRCNITSGSTAPHSYTSATCTAPKTCTKCGTTTGSSLGHSYSAATCSAPKTCTRCRITTGSTAPHSYSAATCTAPKTCTKCGATTGSATGHSYSTATCTTPKTCTKCGATTGSATGHSYSTATCTTPKTCSKCGTTSGTAPGHNYSAATCTTPKTCTRCGATSGSATGHSYSAATCTSPKTCSKCGTTSGSALGHSYSAATCTAPKTCSKCGTTSGSALGHSYSAATCTAPKTCSKCGTTSGSALGHSYSAATCTTPKTCSKCGTTSGSALGHSFSAWTLSRGATCISEGQEVRTCSCGAKEYQATKKANHSFSGRFATTKEPTCTEVGKKAKVCANSNCNAYYDYENIAPLGHVSSGYHTYCEDDKGTGNHTTYCTRCESHYKAPHTMVTYFIQEEGEHIAFCEDQSRNRCGYYQYTGACHSYNYRYFNLYIKENGKIKEKLEVRHGKCSICGVVTTDLMRQGAEDIFGIATLKENVINIIGSSFIDLAESIPGLGTLVGVVDSFKNLEDLVGLFTSFSNAMEKMSLEDSDLVWKDLGSTKEVENYVKENFQINEGDKDILHLYDLSDCTNSIYTWELP